MPDKTSKKKINWIGLIFLLIALAGFQSLHLQTRFKLAGDWACQQVDNGASTTETYGFFGSRESLVSTGTGGQGRFIGSYSLSLFGDVITTKPEFAEAHGRRIAVKPDNGAEARFYETINKLTTKDLSFSLATNLEEKTTTVHCRKL